MICKIRERPGRSGVVLVVGVNIVGDFNLGDIVGPDGVMLEEEKWVRSIKLIDGRSCRH